MKQIFSLAGTLLCALISHVCTAQFYEGFETPEEGLIKNCWKIQQLLNTTNTEVITGSQSLISTPLNKGKVQGRMTTPYLTVPGTSFTLSFNWRLLNKMPGKAWRKISISLLSYKDGSTTEINTIDIPAGTPVEVNQFIQVIKVPAAGIYQLYFQFEGDVGDGNQHLIFDDLQLDGADYNYGPENHCNTAPIANDDKFSAPSGYPVNGQILGNDSEPDNEEVIPSLVDASKDGKIQFYPDGSFLFTPNPDFTGTSTTFTYQLLDNGYKPLSSNKATVTINFFEAAILPVKLISFEGNRNENKKTYIEWKVAENRLADRFEVQRSKDGLNFTTAGLVLASELNNTEEYKFAEPSDLNQSIYYRLKIVNKDKSAFYSTVIKINNEANSKNKIELLQNPVAGALTFRYNSDEHGFAVVRIYNIMSGLEHEQKIMLQRGMNTVTIPSGNTLHTGTYVLEVTGNTSRSTSKFIKL